MANIFKRRGENAGSTNTNGAGFRKGTINTAEDEVLDIKERQIRLEKAEDRRKMWIQSRKYVIIFGIMLVGGLVFKFVIKPQDRSAIETDSVKKCLELDKIENQIIIGIEEKKDKAELLDLVSQLNHEDTDNFIEGKKQGIIPSEVSSPDDDYFGYYSEYYTGLREAYKEIIMTGVSVEEFKAALRKKSEEKAKAGNLTKKENRANYAA
jgi:hypothetical protein